MKYKSVFDIIGPIMIGPSSSHTAGAVRIGQIAADIFGEVPQKIVIKFFGSFAETYKGHATDVAVIAGILGLNTDDPDIKNSLSIAQKNGMDVEISSELGIPVHPNTVKIELFNGNKTLEIVGISIGGGNVRIVEIDNFPLKINGENPAVLIFHYDAYGTIAPLANILAMNKINIAHMEVSRKEKGSEALMIVETDEPITEDVLTQIKNQKNIIRTLTMEN